MADYSSGNFSTLYGTVLGLNSGNISSSVKDVQDGDGNSTALQLSTTEVRSMGMVTSVGNANFGGTCTATSFNGSAAGLTALISTPVSYRTETANYPIVDGDEVVVMNGTSLSVTLPTAADNDGRRIVIVNKAATAVTLVVSGQTIIGSGTTTSVDRTLAAYSSVTLLCANSEFYIIAGSAT